MNRFEFFVNKEIFIPCEIKFFKYPCGFLLFKARPTARFDSLLKTAVLESSLYYIKTEKRKITL